MLVPMVLMRERNCSCLWRTLHRVARDMRVVLLLKKARTGTRWIARPIWSRLQELCLVLAQTGLQLLEVGKGSPHMPYFNKLVGRQTLASRPSGVVEGESLRRKLLPHSILSPPCSRLHQHKALLTKGNLVDLQVQLGSQRVVAHPAPVHDDHLHVVNGHLVGSVVLHVPHLRKRGYLRVMDIVLSSKIVRYLERSQLKA